MANEFLGTGWKFPAQLNEQGGVTTASHEDRIRESILIILGTEKGERVMRPDFGCGIHSLVYTVVNSTTVTLVRSAVRDALLHWEPRIDLLEVRVSTDRLSDGVLHISIDYRVRRTNSEYNLVYPFYLRTGGS